MRSSMGGWVENSLPTPEVMPKACRPCGSWPGTMPPSDGANLTVFAFYNVSTLALPEAQERGTLNPIGSRYLSMVGVTPQATAPLGEVTIAFADA